MGKILSGYLMPHPPIIVEEIGRGEEQRARETLEGCKTIAKDIRDKRPTTIIIISPHGPLFADAISISVEENLKGDFRNFGNRGLKFHFINNKKLVDEIIAESYRQDIMIAKVDQDFAKSYNIDGDLDHGALVPLYFVDKEYRDFELIHITYGLLPPRELYRFGNIIKEKSLESEEDVVLIASGDLSHKLSDDGPYSYSPYGEQFDKKIVNLLEEGDFKSVAAFDLELSERAGECGLRSLMILAGFLDGLIITPEILSYEGPFGVGYCNAMFGVEGKAEEENIFEKLTVLEEKRIKDIRKGEDEYVKLARNSLEHYIKEGNIMDVPKDLSRKLLNHRHGAFVTLKKDGILRGCIGTIEPTRSSLAEEIIHNAISAGLKDPRFEPVGEEELSHLVYSVDVLYPPEPISSIEELDVERYGVIVSKGFRKGLLLPNIEGVDTPREQVSIALRKAGIGEHEDYKLERFEVERHF